MYTAREKYYFLLDTLDEARALTPADEPVFLKLDGNLKNIFTANELTSALRMLDNDETIAHLASGPSATNGEQYEVMVHSNFRGIYRQIQVKDAEYRAYASKSRRPAAATPPPSTSDSVAYTVTYDPHTREILINGLQLAKPDFNSENEVFFTYMYAHPNIKVALATLEAEHGGEFKKTILQILADLGFKGDFKTAFFAASKQMVTFRNSVTFKQLEDAGIQRLKIQK